jgi:hypothetical protein
MANSFNSYYLVFSRVAKRRWNVNGPLLRLASFMSAWFDCGGGGGIHFGFSGLTCAVGSLILRRINENELRPKRETYASIF